MKKITVLTAICLLLFIGIFQIKLVAVEDSPATDVEQASAPDRVKSADTEEIDQIIKDVEVMIKYKLVNVELFTLKRYLDQHFHNKAALVLKDEKGDYQHIDDVENISSKEFYIFATPDSHRKIKLFLTRLEKEIADLQGDQSENNSESQISNDGYGPSHTYYSPPPACSQPSAYTLPSAPSEVYNFWSKHCPTSAYTPPTAPSEETQIALTVYTLSVPADAIMQSLAPRFPTASISYDARTNSLIIAAPHVVHDTIRSEIERLEKELSEGKNNISARVEEAVQKQAAQQDRENVIRIYHFVGYNNGTPNAFANMLKTICPDAIYFFDITSNRLIICATEPEHVKIKEVLDQFDDPQFAKKEEPVLKIIKLGNLQAADIQNIPSLFNAQSGYITIQPCYSANAVILQGSPEQCEKAEALIMKLDQMAKEQQEQEQESFCP